MRRKSASSNPPIVDAVVAASKMQAEVFGCRVAEWLEQCADNKNWDGVSARDFCRATSKLWRDQARKICEQ